MLILLAIQSAAVPMVNVPAPPPILSMTPEVVGRSTMDRQTPSRTTDVDIVIRGPSSVLWNGSLRVGDRGRQSSWSQSRVEPPAADCPAATYPFGGEPEMLSLSLLPMTRDSENSFMVSVRWARRGERGCDGLRTVEVRQSVALTVGQTVSVTADGGLRVELRRRS